MERRVALSLMRNWPHTRPSRRATDASRATRARPRHTQPLTVINVVGLGCARATGWLIDVVRFVVTGRRLLLVAVDAARAGVDTTVAARSRNTPVVGVGGVTGATGTLVADGFSTVSGAAGLGVSVASGCIVGVGVSEGTGAGGAAVSVGFGSGAMTAVGLGAGGAVGVRDDSPGVVGVGVKVACEGGVAVGVGVIVMVGVVVGVSVMVAIGMLVGVSVVVVGIAVAVAVRGGAVGIALGGTVLVVVGVVVDAGVAVGVALSACTSTSFSAVVPSNEHSNLPGCSN